jgi:hypothetical protein
MEMMGNAVVGKGGEDEKKISIDRDGRWTVHVVHTVWE